MTENINKSAHGGVRRGAGRKSGSGRFGEKTKVIRVPESQAETIQAWIKQGKFADIGNFSDLFVPANEATIRLPLYASKVIAGFPSPAEDYVEARLDLNEKLIRNQEATFLLKVQGDSMRDAGILDGDILVVDRSVAPADGKIVIAALDGDLTVKRLRIRDGKTWLLPENPDYPPIAIREESDMVIWGVVTASISQY
ncbi:translesion error-prone DNA polymerase V autoproteolytic subunit [Thiomicrorhabdus sp. HH1]|uniref:Translesion error-prone DNA polymerase V autoproteolytic subunit n=1 Tax=Thiomicrorhabdus heinhorstiae TaxID=2748010 RepID=A0ABS0BVD5_9GAMM|nr:translesion error-prone DNA polymerase V autoproteolytic subunit [Thiomicrorhabdus heinhorstiae]